MGEATEKNVKVTQKVVLHRCNNDRSENSEIEVHLDVTHAIVNPLPEHLENIFNLQSTESIRLPKMECQCLK